MRLMGKSSECKICEIQRKRSGKNIKTSTSAPPKNYLFPLCPPPSIFFFSFVDFISDSPVYMMSGSKENVTEHQRGKEKITKEVKVQD